MRKTYELCCPLPPEAAMGRIENLLTVEGVQFRTANLSLSSTATPIAVLGIQRRFYSRRNWVGLNPFAFVSGIDVRCEVHKDDGTRVFITVDRFRAFLWVVFWGLCAGFAGVGIPEPLVAVLLFLGITTGAWLGVVSFLGAFLIKKEIKDCLDSASTA